MTGDSSSHSQPQTTWQGEGGRETHSSLFSCHCPYSSIHLLPTSVIPRPHGSGKSELVSSTYRIEQLHKGFNPHKNTLGTEGSVNWSRVQPKTN